MFEAKLLFVFPRLMPDENDIALSAKVAQVDKLANLRAFANYVESPYLFDKTPFPF